MGVQLNIKDAETRKLAEELARESGQSITRAVNEALRERLKAVRGERAVTDCELKEREQRFDEIIEGSRALWREELLSGDYNDMLYDERGLPR